MLTLGKLKKIAFDELSPIFELNEDNFRLEEYEFDESNITYNIVVSFLVENKNIESQTLTKISLLGGLKYDRVYKKVSIDKDGKFIKFSIYNPKL